MSTRSSVTHRVLPRLLLAGMALIGTPIACHAQAQPASALKGPEYPALNRNDILQPYSGPIEKGVDTSTLHGKVMCGYQGWFCMPGDGSGLGVVHWGEVQANPPRSTVDFWPDMSELPPEERFPTNYKLADGSTAYTYSAVVKATTIRHFKWMKDYGIDGVFVQRFLSQTGSNPNGLRTDAVLSHCREGANRYGRSFAVMYDTGFDRASVKKMEADWRKLVQQMRILDTPAYQKHRGAPVVALWGYGFAERGFDKQACEELFQFFKAPENGACTILLGVENDWRQWARGNERQRGLMELMERYGDIIQPWNVGRYGTLKEAQEHVAKYFPDDIQWCKQRNKDYYAVIFPGFSWANLRKGTSPLNQIPRLGGRFFWNQAELVKKYGMDMVYVAMFDEVDEGTAITKCTNNPPVGRFNTFEGLPSDQYLKLAGLAGQLLRGEDVSFPAVKPDPAQSQYRPLSLREYYQGELTLTPQSAQELQKLYQSIPVTLVGTKVTCSSWAYALTAPTFQVREVSWADLVHQKKLNPAQSPLLVLGDGGQSIGGPTREEDPEQSAAIVSDYLQQGGTLLVLSGGRYPMYYPGEGVLAKRLGLHLIFLPDESFVIQFKGPLATLGQWQQLHFGARVPSRDSYSQDVAYQSLASIGTTGGKGCGDAVALIGPGGELGKGRIIYVASDLQRHPDRQQILATIMEYTAAQLGR